VNEKHIHIHRVVDNESRVKEKTMTSR